jgi:cytosine/adenosine deaminase-related metal-dependent hydrolase
VPGLVVRGCDVLRSPERLERGVDLWIVDGRIADAPDAPPAVDEIDGRGLLAMPGLVNSHTHSPENCLRGLGEGMRLEPWLCLMYAVCGEYDAEDHYVCALAGAVEMLLTGTTSCVDHLWMTPPSVEGVEAALRAYEDAGIRATVAPLMGDRDDIDALAGAHGVDVGAAMAIAEAGFLPAAEQVAQLDELLRRHEGKVMAGPAGLQWCSDELLEGLVELDRTHGCGIQLHALETAIQAEACRLRFGTGAVRALDRLGVLGPRTSLAHSIWLDEGDAELLAERGAAVVHNPAANQRLGSGRAPIRRLLDAGVPVALGTDGAASSDNQVLWDSIKLAALIHTSGDGWVSSRDALRMATSAGASVLGRSDRLGELEPGAPADVALLDLAGEGLAGERDLAAALALSETGRGVRHVIVGGRVVVRDGRCLTVDRAEVMERLREQAQRRRASLPPDAERGIRQLEELQRVLR